MAYHDEEWGVPVRDDRELWEKLVLDGFQAGLSWITVLRKRAAFRAAFEGFDPKVVARYDEARIAGLLQDPGIIRSRGKIAATVGNARAWIEIQESGPGFSELLWSFVGGEPRVNQWRVLEELPASTAESAAMARELKSRGFKFVGPTICYAFMQAVGLVNDHLVGCFRYGELVSQ